MANLRSKYVFKDGTISFYFGYGNREGYHLNGRTQDGRILKVGANPNTGNYCSGTVKSLIPREWAEEITDEEFENLPLVEV